MYKNKICGVYLITNNLNGMSYVGQSIDCKSRWSYHKGPYAKRPIDKAIKEFGSDNFTFRIEKECLPEELDYYERETIKKYKTLYPNGYNYQGGGKNGFEICEESRRKMSENYKGEGNPMFGKPRPEDTRKRISKTKKGKPHLHPKYKYLTPSGEIKEMSAHMVSHWHKDWIRIEE